MPQDKNAKYITRRDFGIYDQRLVPMTSSMGRRPDGSYRYRAGDTRTVGGDQERGDVNARNKFSGDISDLGLSQKRPSNFTSPEGKGIAADNLIVGTRDAHNANAMRTNLGNRASAAAQAANTRAKRNSAVGQAGRKAGLIGTLATGAVLAAQRGAEDVDMTEHDNAYGSAALGGSNGSYSGQGKMSKALGVKNTKPGM
jgi:hypothetical protein